MKIKTPVLIPNATSNYHSANDKFNLCGERTREVLGVGPFEKFRLIISTKEMKNGFRGKLYNKNGDIFFKKKGDKNTVEFSVKTEDWIFKRLPKLMYKGESIKIWVKLKSYSPHYAKMRE